MRRHTKGKKRRRMEWNEIERKLEQRQQQQQTIMKTSHPNRTSMTKEHKSASNVKLKTNEENNTREKFSRKKQREQITTI